MMEIYPRRRGSRSTRRPLAHRAPSESARALQVPRGGDHERDQHGAHAPRALRLKRGHRNRERDLADRAGVGIDEQHAARARGELILEELATRLGALDAWREAAGL